MTRWVSQIIKILSFEVQNFQKSFIEKKIVIVNFHFKDKTGIYVPQIVFLSQHAQFQTESSIIDVV